MQPLVVARVQADRRLVEHVERADERRAERRRQVDALRLAAGERRRQPVERQVVEADVAQERQPAADLAQHLLGDRRFLLRRAASSAKNCCASRTVSADTDVDRPAADAHVARLAPQPRAAAVGTGQVAAVAAEEHADVHLVLLPLEPAEEAADAVVLVVALDDELPFLVRSAPPTARRGGRRPSSPPASARRAARGSAACSTARWRPG